MGPRRPKRSAVLVLFEILDLSEEGECLFVGHATEELVAHLALSPFVGAREEGVRLVVGGGVSRLVHKVLDLLLVGSIFKLEPPPFVGFSSSGVHEILVSVGEL